MLTRAGLQDTPRRHAARPVRRLERPDPTRAARTLNIARRNTGFHRFPLNNFKYFLTLFSKFFSPFAHATCSLSVSPPYLALDETYHPFYVALPSNATLRTQVVRGKLRIMNGILTLYDAFFQKTYIRVAADFASLGYNSSGR
jgi:hypothetical protein